MKNYQHLIGTIPGLSERQLKAHFGLYEGYVKKAKEIEEKLAVCDPALANYSYGETSELMRRHAVPYNGAKLHELYFENLTGAATQPNPDLSDLIRRSFGSLERWSQLAKAGLSSGVVWVLLTYSRSEEKLRADLVEEHHRGVLVDQEILLALDGWEHAYMIDYGTSKSDYIEALFKAIDWNSANARWDRARRMSAAIKQLAA